MSQFHLESLRDRELEGVLTAEERAQLDAHVAACEVCQLERAMGRNVGSGELDAELLDRAFVRARREVVRSASTPARSFARPLALAAGVLLALTVAGGAAAATFPSVRALFGPFNVESAPASGPRPAARTQERPHANTPSEPVAAPEVAMSEPVMEAEAAPEDADEIQTQRAQLAARRHASPPPGPDALFQRAQDARREGSTLEAVRHYRRLQRSYPASRRANTSRISLGTLLLGPLGDPEGALAQYDAYLARSPRGSLAEQALVGRARALQALGRRGEARAAWRTLLETYPDSLHAERARRALAGP